MVWHINTYNVNTYFKYICYFSLIYNPIRDVCFHLHVTMVTVPIDQIENMHAM